MNHQTNNDLKKRIIYLSYKHQLSHIGSVLTAVDIIDEIYEARKIHEPFILSSGHAGLALYVVLEKHEGHDAEELLNIHGVHPSIDILHGIWASSGSLGHGIGIAVGMALAKRDRRVYVLLSDGELSEGSVYESFNTIREQKLGNIVIYINYNGWGAYRQTSIKPIISLTSLLSDVCEVNIRKTHVPQFDFMKGLKAHYSVLDETSYQQLLTCYAS